MRSGLAQPSLSSRIAQGGLGEVGVNWTWQPCPWAEPQKETQVGATS